MAKKKMVQALLLAMPNFKETFSGYGLDSTSTPEGTEFVLQSYPKPELV